MLLQYPLAPVRTSLEVACARSAGVCCLLLYVDDLSISFAASRMQLVERKLQVDINKISRWADTRGFRFSSSKTIIMHFCRLLGMHPDPELFVSGRKTSCEEETRFLCLIFDIIKTSRYYIKTACMKVVSLLKALTHTSRCG